MWFSRKSEQAKAASSLEKRLRKINWCLDKAEEHIEMYRFESKMIQNEAERKYNIRLATAPPPRPTLEQIQ